MLSLPLTLKTPGCGNSLQNYFESIKDGSSYASACGAHGRLDCGTFVTFWVLIRRRGGARGVGWACGFLWIFPGRSGEKLARRRPLDDQDRNAVDYRIIDLAARTDQPSRGLRARLRGQRLPARRACQQRGNLRTPHHAHVSHFKGSQPPRAVAWKDAMDGDPRADSRPDFRFVLPSMAAPLGILYHET